jgi:transposase
MSYPTTADGQDSGKGAVLLVALELSVENWKVALGTGAGRPRRVDVRARDLSGLLEAIAKAKQHFGLSADAAVLSCYEAGRDGFWLHRALTAEGLENLVIDAGSIEVSRKVRAKTDRLDLNLLYRKLVLHGQGEQVWSVVRVPSEEVEDNRRLQRELDRLKKDRTRLRSRIWSDLALEGLRPRNLRRALARLDQLRRWNGQPLPPMLRLRIEGTAAELGRVEERIRELEGLRRERVKKPETNNDRKVAVLITLRGIGETGASKIVSEHLWREFDNRRQVAAAAGLTGTPHQSGQQSREQGLGKQGNPRVRALMVELAWLWLRYQPDSALARWWRERFEGGGSRARKVGICAVARRLLIALWRMVEFGEVPEGARLKVA